MRLANLLHIRQKTCINIFSLKVLIIVNIALTILEITTR